MSDDARQFMMMVVVVIVVFVPVAYRAFLTEASSAGIAWPISPTFPKDRARHPSGLNREGYRLGRTRAGYLDDTNIDVKTPRNSCGGRSVPR